MMSKTADPGTDRSRYLVEVLFGLAAVSIWAGWIFA